MTRPRQRIVVCRGQYCNLSRRADAILKALEPLLDAANGDDYPKPVKLEIANCLSHCGAGPNLIIYPQGVVCHQVQPADLPNLLETHLLKSDDSPS